MKLRQLLIAASLVSVAFASTAVATHDSPDCTLEDPPGEVVTVPASETGQANDLYINDRPGEGAPTGTGLLTGGGTWIYEEANDIDGLQTDADADSTSDQSICGHTPDTLIF
jgi:hypothetical protein